MDDCRLLRNILERVQSLVQIPCYREKIAHTTKAPSDSYLAHFLFAHSWHFSYLFTFSPQIYHTQTHTHTKNINTKCLVIRISAPLQNLIGRLSFPSFPSSPFAPISARWLLVNASCTSPKGLISTASTGLFKTHHNVKKRLKELQNPEFSLSQPKNPPYSV